MQPLARALFLLFAAFVIYVVLFFVVFAAGCGSGDGGVGRAAPVQDA